MEARFDFDIINHHSDRRVGMRKCNSTDSLYEYGELEACLLNKRVI